MGNPISNEISRLSDERRKFINGTDAIISFLIGMKLIIYAGACLALGYIVMLDTFQQAGVMGWLTSFHFNSSLDPTIHSIMITVSFTAVLVFGGGLRMWLKFSRMLNKFVANKLIILVNYLDMYFWRKTKKDSIATTAMMKISSFALRHNKKLLLLIIVYMVSTYLIGYFL